METGSRLSNGRFAPGNGRPANAGRRKGTPNRTTRAVREFLAALAEDVAIQDAVRERILAGDAVAFFRAVDHVLGRPKESVDVNVPQSDLLIERIAGMRKRRADALRAAIK
jgi:hypothetical protein